MTGASFSRGLSIYSSPASILTLMSKWVFSAYVHRRIVPYQKLTPISWGPRLSVIIPPKWILAILLYVSYRMAYPLYHEDRCARL